jgi:hypothetical protein
MPSIISTKTSGGGGIAVTGDTSGVLELQSNNGTTAVTISTGQVVSFVNNFGTVAGLPSFQCRAWVNFNGTGTVAIRASGNVTSITDNGNGDYTLNYTTAFPDANYAITGSCTSITGVDVALVQINSGPLGSFPASTTTTSRFVTTRAGLGGAASDVPNICISVFR